MKTENTKKKPSSTINTSSFIMRKKYKIFTEPKSSARYLITKV